MNRLTHWIGRILFPRISPELQREIDKSNVRNIYLICIITMCLQTLLLLAFIFSRLDRFGTDELQGVLRTCVCVVICAANVAVVLRLRKTEKYSYGTVTLITVADYLLLMGLAVYTAYVQHLRGEQYFTFYAVLLGFVCFISYRPIIACILTAAAYLSLGLVIQRTGGTLGTSVLNYASLAVISAVAMITRYDQQIKVSRTFLELESRNRDLSRTSRHDALTGLKNREALTQDSRFFIGVPLTVVMADIDDFKQVNDVHGHAVGDRALREAARVLQEAYLGAMVYRYGGDEFLAVFRDMEKEASPETVTRDVHFNLPIRNGSLELSLSVGVASGTASGEAELKALIDRADIRLYEQKRERHQTRDQFSMIVE